jgi:Trypsin
MRRMLMVVAVALLVLAVPASAITDGELDGNGHPYVGLMVAQDAKGNPLWRCSGTLISAKVFLTAGHCTEAPAAHVEIWFDADVESGRPANGYPFDGDAGGTPFTHPSYNPNAFFLFDLGAVVLDKPLKMKKYGALPRLNQLDALKVGSSTTFTSVGYGLQRINPAKVTELRVRMVAHPHLIQINGGIVGDFSLLLSNNASTGGTCFGDSGGPIFYDDSNVIVAVTSFGLSPTCTGVDYAFRIDQEAVLAWILEVAAANGETITVVPLPSTA